MILNGDSTMKIQTAELVRYNANTRGSRVGDCTARAISLAFNIDYSKARKALNDSAKQHYGWEFNTHDNCIKVIRELGGGELIKCGLVKTSVDKFIDEHPSGTYIIWCSKDGTVRKSNHLACVIDGKVYDSWDSRTYYILGYWVIESGIKGTDITNIKDALQQYYRENLTKGDYYHEVYDSIIDKNRKLKKLSDEYDVDVVLTLSVYQVSLNNYTYRCELAVRIDIYEWSIRKTCNHTITVTFKPTLKPEEIDSYFKDTFYGKLYSFIQGTIVYYVEDYCKGHKFLNDTSTTHNVPLPEQKGMTFYNKTEKKSYDNLPYWVRRIATYFAIDRIMSWGEPSIEVTLIIHTPPFDTEYGNCSDRRRFVADNMDQLREMLEHYKNTGNYEETSDIRYQY